MNQRSCLYLVAAPWLWCLGAAVYLAWPYAFVGGVPGLVLEAVWLPLAVAIVIATLRRRWARAVAADARRTAAVPPPRATVQEIRGTHPYAFRSGQWARLTGTMEDPETGRVCYAVVFPDGAADWWPVEDAVAGYEFRET